MKPFCLDRIKNNSYELSDPLGFEEWQSLIKSGKASVIQYAEKDLRFIKHFVEMVASGKQPEEEVMNYIASSFHEVISNVNNRWEDSFLLPWTEISVSNGRAEIIDLEVWAQVSQSIDQDPDIGVITAIREAAEKWNVSYEKARAA